MAKFLAILVLVAACGGEEEVPSCQQAVMHYYGAGCAYYELDSGDEIPVNEFIGQCQQLRAAEPPGCGDDLDDFLVCLDSVPNGAETFDDCDCSVEQDALLTCG